MELNGINLQQKLGLLAELWSPRIIAQLNNYHIKLARVQGDFIWHSHADTDELFLVLGGRLILELPEGRVPLGPGELYVVPRGVQHRPVAEQECQVLLIEPAGTINTGDTAGTLTAQDNVWI